MSPSSFGILPFIGLFALVAIWILVPTTGAVVPPFGDVLNRAGELISQGSLLQDTRASLVRVMAGTLIAIVTAAVFGIVCSVRWARKLLQGPLEFARPVPPIAWIPLMILLFGVGERSAIAIVSMAAFFPMALAILFAWDEVDRDFVLAAKSLGAGPIDLAVNIYLPSMLAAMFVGVRVGVGLGWFSVVAAEMVGSFGGLGYGIQVSSLNLEMERFFVYLILIAACGFVMNQAVMFLEWLALPWRRG